MLDACNLLDDDAPLAINDTYGSQWQVPENILIARFVKFGPSSPDRIPWPRTRTTRKAMNGSYPAGRNLHG